MTKLSDRRGRRSLNSTVVFQSNEKSTEWDEKSYVFLCSDLCNFLKVFCPLYRIFFSFSCTLSHLQSFCFTIIFVLRAFNKRWTFPKIAFALNVFNFFFKEKAFWPLKSKMKHVKWNSTQCFFLYARQGSRRIIIWPKKTNV